MNRLITTALTVALAASLHAFVGIPQQSMGRKAYPYFRHSRHNSSGRAALRLDASSVSDAMMARRSPVRIAENIDSEIYGYLGYTDREEFEAAMCRISGSTYSPVWVDPVWEQGAEVTTGWLVDDVLHTVASVAIDGMVLNAYNVRQNFYTGKIIGVEELNGDDHFFAVATYNESDGCVYGVYTTPDGWMWGTAPLDNLRDIQSICEADDAHNFVSLAYCPEDASMYGINSELNFTKIGVDGNLEVIAPVNLDKEVIPYITGLVYSPSEKLFYWNVNYADDTAALFTISVADGKFTKVCDYESCEEFMYMVTPERPVIADAPAMPECIDVSFPGGASKGSISFRMPSKFNSGQALEGNLEWELYMDTAPYTSGTAAPESVVKIDFSSLEEGRHVFAMTVSSGNRTSNRAVKVVFIGKDVPLAPANVTLTEKALTWDAVTEGVDGGYVDVSAMTYHIYSGTEEVASTKETLWNPSLPSDLELKAYSFDVVAEYGEKYMSRPASSNYLVYGKPFTVPVSFEPTFSQSLLFTVDDANEDGRGWEFDSGEYDDPVGEPSFKCLYGLIDSDEWLFMPAVNFVRSDRFYTLRFDCKSLVAQFPSEFIEVYMGDQPTKEAMKQKVLGRFTPTPQYQTYEAYVGTATPDVAYIGFHCTSKADMAGIGIKNMSLADENVSPATPAPADKITVAGAAKGELMAEVSFTFPISDISGNPLPGDAALSAVVTAEESVTVEGAPGETVGVSVKTKQGRNRISIVVSYGGMQSVPAFAGIFSGVDIPGAVSGLAYKISADMMGVTLDWNAPTEGAEGGYIDPEKLTYSLCLLCTGDFGNYWEILEDNIKETTVTYTLPAGSIQEFVQLGIKAVNALGESQTVTNVDLVIGTPYKLPMADDFGAMDSGSDFNVSPYVSDAPDAAYTCNWSLSTPGKISSALTDKEGFYLAAKGVPSSRGRLGIPCFSTLAGDTRIEVTALSGNGFAPVTVLAECLGMEKPLTLGTTTECDPTRPGTWTFSLPVELEGKEWVQVYFDTTIPAGAEYCAIRGYKVWSTSGIDIIEGGDVKVMSSDNTLFISGTEGMAVNVYTLDGRLVWFTRNATSNLRVSLDPGLYLVNVGSTTIKAILR